MSPRSSLAPWIIACAVLFSPRPSAAQSAPRTRLVAHADSVVRVNPAGTALLVGGFARRVLAYDQARQFESAYLQAGVQGGLNPAYGQVGAHVEALPLPVLVLRAQYDQYQFFGANGALVSFPTASASFGADAIAKAPQERTTASRTLLQTTLRGMFGPVILRLQYDAAWFGFNGRGPWYHEWEYDTLLQDRSWLHALRVQAPVRLWKGRGESMLLAGPGWEWVHAVNASLNRHRVGLVGYYCPADRWGALARPRVFTQLGVNVEDPNRQHQPWLVAGIGADWE